MSSESISVSSAIPIVSLIHERITVISLEGGDIAIYPVGTATPKILQNETPRVWALEISGDLLFCGADTGTITIWNFETGEKLKVLEGHTSTVRCIKVFGSGSLVSASRDGTLRVWDIESGTLRQTLTGHGDTIRSIAIQGNKIVSASHDSTARLWDVDTGACLARFTGHTGTVFSVAFEGNTIITGCLDTKVRIWDAQTGQMTALLHEHGSLVSHILIHGNSIYTASADGQIIVWQREPPELVNEIFAHEHGIIGLDLTSNEEGDYLISGGSDGVVSVCNIRSGGVPVRIGEVADAVYTVGFQGSKAVSVVRRNGETLLETALFGDQN